MADYPVVKEDLYERVAPPPTHFVAIDALREKHRFFWNDQAQGYWVLTRFNDIREAFQTRRPSPTTPSWRSTRIPPTDFCPPTPIRRST